MTADKFLDFLCQTFPGADDYNVTYDGHWLVVLYDGTLYGTVVASGFEEEGFEGRR